MRYRRSNCLLESIKVFLKNPFSISIYKKGSWKLIRKKTFPHFYWYCRKEDKYYHFQARYSDEPFLDQLWFQGSIEEFRYHK